MCGGYKNAGVGACRCASGCTGVRVGGCANVSVCDSAGECIGVQVCVYV